MSAETSSELNLIRDQARKLLRERAKPATLRRLLDTRGEFDRELWTQMAELGWLGLGIPEEFGGSGMGLVEQAVIAEEVGRALAAVPFGATLHAAVPALLRSGSTSQRQRWLPAIAAGECVATFAFAEARDAGLPDRPEISFAQGRLDGEKNAVCAGAFADLVIVFARCTEASDGVVLALVDLRHSGVERIAVDSADNSRGLATLRFRGAVAEPLDAAGREAARAVLAHAALMTCFEQVGGAEACLEAARDYALQRRAFGQPIGAFQAIKHRLADMYTTIEVARGNALQGLEDSGSEGERAGAAARLAGNRAYDFAAQESIQVHGAIGVTWEAEQHLHYRRARSLSLEWGSSLYWRERLLRRIADRTTLIEAQRPSVRNA